MTIHANRTPASNSHATDAAAKPKAPGQSAIQLKDIRPEAMDQMQLQELANNSPQAEQSKTYQAMANGSAQVRQLKAIQAMANGSAIKTLQQKEHTEEEIIQQVALPLQKKKLEGVSNNGQAIQRVIDPTALIGRQKMLYQRLPIKLMTDQYQTDWNDFLRDANTVDELTVLVNNFLALKTKERQKEEEDRKAAALAKHQKDVADAQAAAEARRIKEAQERAEKEAAAEIARVAAAAEAARVAAEAAAAAAAQAAEDARLAALFAPGKHRILSVNTVESFMQNGGYTVTFGQEYNDRDGRNEHGERIHDYGIYINIKAGAGAAMTTHFHVHAGIGAGGSWDAHFKKGMSKASNQGGYVSQADTQRLFTLLGYNP